MDTCEDLQKIIADSRNGFKNAANLQFSDFNKPAMGIVSDFPDYSGKIIKNAAVYQAYKSVSEVETAKRLYFAAFINTQSCLQNAEFDNTTPSGYISYSKFLMKVNNSEVTVFLNLKQTAKDQYMVTIYVVNAQSVNASVNQQNSQISNNLVPKNENTIIAGRGWDKIIIGATRSEIESQLGKPDAGDDKFATYYNKGLVVNYDTAQLVKIIRFIGDAANYSGGKTNFRSSAGKPDKNLAWGASRQQVIAAYGTPVKEDSFNDVAEVIYNDIEFNFKNDRLTVIAVKAGANAPVKNTSLVVSNQTNSESNASLQEAKTLFEAQKFEEAVAKLNPIIAREASNEEALTFRARAFIILKKVPEAAADADKILALNPKNTFALNVRGMVKGANKDFNGAIADFTQAVTIDPNFYRAYYQRARAKMFLKMSVNEVLADFDAFLKLNEEPTILAEAGYYCSDNGGELKTCANYFTRLKAKNPNSADGYLGYATVYTNAFSQITDQSILKGEVMENFRKAMELDPKSEYCPLNLGRLLLNLEDYDKAITAFNQAIAINPKRAWTYAMRADSYRLKKDYDNAIVDYSKAIELDPNYKWAYEYRGKTRYQKWRDPNLKGVLELEYYAAMQKDFVKWIEFNPNNYEVYKDFDRYELGLFSKDDFYKKLIAANPKNVCAGYFLAEGAGMGKIENWKAIVDNYDGNNGGKCASGAALQLGRIYADGADDYQKFQPDYAKARQFYDLAAKFDPSSQNNIDNWIAQLPKELKGTPVSGDSGTSNSTQSKRSGVNSERVARAIEAYDAAHERVEGFVKAYVDAENKLNKAGQGAFLMKGTQAARYRAKDSAISEIEELLDKQGKYLPKELVKHILDDYDLVGGVRNFDYLLDEN